MKDIVLFIILLSITKVYAQNNQLLTPAQLKEDANFFFKTLHTLHPNPYYYYSLEEFEDKKNEIYSQLDKSLTHEQFVWIIGEINSYLDMHSMINLFSPMYGRENIFNKNIKHFPLTKIENKKLYLKTFSGEIETINGIRSDSIIQDLNNYFNWKLPSKRNIRAMEINFNIFLMFKYGINAPFKVKFENSNDVQSFDGISIDEYIKGVSGGPRGISYGYSYKIYPTSSIAIFNLPGFEDKSRDKLEHKLKDFFKEVDSLSIQHIFYDLSMNGGGYPYFKPLDIIKHDSVFFRYTAIGDAISQFNRKYNMNQVILLPNNNSNISEERKLYILQGIETASGADYFCRIVAENKLGVLVGQNTGEPTTAFSYSSRNEMPNSKIRFNTATTFMDFSDHFKGETLHPDLYWDVDISRELTEKELMDIVEQCKNIK